MLPSCLLLHWDSSTLKIEQYKGTISNRNCRTYGKKKKKIPLDIKNRRLFTECDGNDIQFEVCNLQLFFVNGRHDSTRNWFFEKFWSSLAKLYIIYIHTHTDLSLVKEWAGEALPSMPVMLKLDYSKIRK